MVKKVFSIKKNKKKIVIILMIVLILCIPFKRCYKDGGTIEYRAVLYSVKDYHAMWSENGTDGYLEGYTVKIFGIKVYDNTYFEPYE